MTTGMASCTRAETWSSALELTVGLRHQAAFGKHFAGEPLAGAAGAELGAALCLQSVHRGSCQARGSPHCATRTGVRGCTALSGRAIRLYATDQSMQQRAVSRRQRRFADRAAAPSVAADYRVRRAASGTARMRTWRLCRLGGDGFDELAKARAGRADTTLSGVARTREPP